MYTLHRKGNNKFKGPSLYVFIWKYEYSLLIPFGNMLFSFAYRRILFYRIITEHYNSVLEIFSLYLK